MCRVAARASSAASVRCGRRGQHLRRGLAAGGGLGSAGPLATLATTQHFHFHGTKHLVLLGTCCGFHASVGLLDRVQQMLLLRNVLVLPFAVGALVAERIGFRANFLTDGVNPLHIET